jgi:hypothetical protein
VVILFIRPALGLRPLRADGMWWVRHTRNATPGWMGCMRSNYFFISFARIWNRPARPPKRALTFGE